MSFSTPTAVETLAESGRDGADDVFVFYSWSSRADRRLWSILREYIWRLVLSIRTPEHSASATLESTVMNTASRGRQRILKRIADSWKPLGPGYLKLDAKVGDIDMSGPVMKSDSVEDGELNMVAVKEVNEVWGWEDDSMPDPLARPIGPVIGPSSTETGARPDRLSGSSSGRRRSGRRSGKHGVRSHPAPGRYRDRQRPGVPARTHHEQGAAPPAVSTRSSADARPSNGTPTRLQTAPTTNLLTAKSSATTAATSAESATSITSPRMNTARRARDIQKVCDSNEPLGPGYLKLDSDRSRRVPGTPRFAFIKGRMNNKRGYVDEGLDSYVIRYTSGEVELVPVEEIHDKWMFNDGAMMDATSSYPITPAAAGTSSSRPTTSTAATAGPSFRSKALAKPAFATPPPRAHPPRLAPLPPPRPRTSPAPSIIRAAFIRRHQPRATHEKRQHHPGTPHQRVPPGGNPSDEARPQRARPRKTALRCHQRSRDQLRWRRHQEGRAHELCGPVFVTSAAGLNTCLSR
ncbi:hypothetical protein BDK51DRAFT_41136 [Blyttiomyces helicus]|uniref:Uncharacterized protein n=1 Tax=Blyttiomyces helicus TaxID=388810 RepID=A0A4P9WFY6_9FUNG|nr:hypothetical protein BDK51DRAFT_41136 [Blyttiomyces helicus]|eukprot:RKO89356.1 hypothetical protein BDK51DRAFT_41136 [Blyttiomyces helicus]